MFESLLPWKSTTSINHWCVCIRACACVRVRGHVDVYVRISVCSLANPACNAYAPYCDVIRGPSVSTMFSILSHKRCHFSKKVIEHKTCVWFSLQHLSRIFLILRKIKRDIVKNVEASPCKVPVFLSDFNETWILWTDFFKKTCISSHEQSVQWEPSCSMLTDGHDEGNSRFSQFFERA